MSIKKLFGQTDENTNYLSDTNEKNLFKAVESAKNAIEIHKKQKEFNPQIDYSDPANFARYGSARLYYSGAIGRILDYYPYDGSDAEQNEFFNKSLGIERYIFNNLWPRTNGYANFNSASYIDFRGGPNTISSSTTAGLFKDEDSSKRSFANIYDEQIYTTEGLPTNYGTGSRQSNLRANFDSGVTVEFWLKSKNIATNANSVIFDMWNNNASGAIDMGRMTIEILSSSASSPFAVTVQSGTMTSGGKGSGSVFQQLIGQNLLSTALDDWQHYAFVFENSGSDFVSRLYINGYENDTVINSNINIGELPSKDMTGRIGSLLTVPFRSDAASSTRTANTHLLTGSIDEFRYWKEARSSEDIGRNWYKQVRGGSNSDISNTTLGVYYKFNEGTTGTTAIDKNVLDYSGRLTNGTWTGTAERQLSSAIIESSASVTEYKDPIIYITHPNVVELKNGLNDSGSFHDFNNNTNFYSYMPSWIMEEHDRIGNSNPEVVSHIIGSYFDKIYGLITAVPGLKGEQNTSASFSPISFAEHLPQSLGLATPNLFVESDVMNSLLNSTEDFKFRGDLTETKNLIYQNIYNNLSDIYKSKGTERAIKNILRCFHLDDSIIKFKTYADNSVYELNSNSVQILKDTNMLLFNSSSNVGAVCYIKQDPDDTSNSRGFISGSGGTTHLGSGAGYEDGYGFTTEVNVRFPRFDSGTDKVSRKNIMRSSIFGIYSASVDSPDNPKWIFDNGGADFQVYANRLDDDPRSVFFSVTSSMMPGYELTSSTFFDVYNNTNWNISVRLKPSTYPLATFVTGNTTNFTYDLIFEGINTNLGTVSDSFSLTGSVTKADGTRFLNSAKRVYAGANRTNITGALNHRSDVLISDVRYWAKFIDSESLKQHAFDFENRGISGSFRNIAPYAPKNVPHEMLNIETLALHWNFNDLTSSNSNGNFFTQDVSSGSAADVATNGWLGGVSGILHKGFGHGFVSNSTSIKSKQQINTFKFIDPEQATSSDMINILTNDDEVYGFSTTIPNFFNTLEKSMYDAISDEMLTFFAGAIDFHNLIGEPVNRYRERYKAMEHMRRVFFKRVNATTEVEKYVEYYKWFDSAISKIIKQLIPAASKFTENTMNIVESHVLERNKYRTLFPTLEFQSTDPETPMLGIRERLYQWSQNHHPLSAQATDNPDWWRDRAERSLNPTIAAGDTTLDHSRDIYRETIANDNNQKKEVRGTLTQGSYLWTPYAKRKLSLPYKFDAIVESDYLTTYSPLKSIKGGVNFRHPKNIDYVYNALRPAGRINEENGNFVPENVLYSQLLERDGTLKDLMRETRFKRGLVYGPEPHPNDQLYRNRPSEKVILNTRVQHGRDPEGYSSMNARAAFPFNIVSSSVTTGYNKEVVERVTGNIEITNLHHDVYGEDMEKPMQTMFTEQVVGGHQSRHVPINIGNDNETNRPEAWKIKLGYPTGPDCPPDGGGNNIFGSGAIGMVGPDYPEAEARFESGRKPYPATASLKAPWYRDFTTKQPFNIKNIQLRAGPSGTFPTRLGNYRNTYEFIQTVGAWSNPIGFRDGPPSFTTTGSVGEILAFKDNSNSNKATSIRTLRDIKRNSDGRSGVADYSVEYLTGAKNHSVIIQRFSHRGGIEVDTKGYQDFRSTEFSVYNAVPYRNLTVRRPSQTPATNISNPVENGDTTNIQVFDIHGMDYGLTPHLARHSARFGRDSLIYPDDNARKPYDLKESFFGYGDKKIYRSGDKLMGWWRFDSNNFTTAVSGNALDSSGNNRNGTFNSGSLYRPLFSSSLGPSDFIQTGSAAFNNFTSSLGVNTTAVDIGSGNTWDAIIGNNTGAGSTQKMTFAAWINPVAEGSSGFSRIFSMSGEIDVFTNQSRQLGLLAFWETSGSSTAVVWIANDAVNYDVWSHVAITYDASSNLNNPKIYLNGSEVSVRGPFVNGGGSIDPDDMSNFNGIGTVGNCFIGNLASQTLKNEYAFQGNIADAAIWNTNLGSDEVAAIYNASKYEEDFGPGYSDEQSVVQELPSFHKVNRNSLREIGIKSETTKIQTEVLKEGLVNNGFAKTAAVTGSNSFLLTGSTQRSNFDDFFMSALTGAGGSGRTSDVAGQGGAGISWSGWVKFQEDGTSFDDEETLWAFGLRRGNTPLMRLVKETESTLANGVDWYLIVDTMHNSVSQPANGATNTYKWNVTDVDFSGSWNHIALVWGSPNDGTNIAQAPVGAGSDTNGTFSSTADGVTLATADSGATFYVNGVSQSYESFTSVNNGHRYDIYVNAGGRADYKGFTEQHIQAAQSDQAAFIGGGWTNGTSDNNALSADIDEWSFWTVALDSGSIQELYNSGVACNITGTTLYENSGAFLFDWLRFQNTDAGGSSAFAVNPQNPGEFSNNNRLVGFTNSSSWLPLANAGADNWTISQENFLTGCDPVLNITTQVNTIHHGVRKNDNFFVQHPIPRSDRQYSFFTGAIEDPNPDNVRFSGYMPVFGPAQGKYKSGSNYEEWMITLSGADYGSYSFDIGGSEQAGNAFGLMQKTAEELGYVGVNLTRDNPLPRWMPQTFMLNNFVVEPIDTKENIQGYPLTNSGGTPVPLFTRSYGTPTDMSNTTYDGSGITGGPHYANRSYHGQPSFFQSVNDTPMFGGVSSSGEGSGYNAWSMVLNQGFFFNALMLKRNGPYGYGTHAQFRRNPNHPILRSHRTGNTISVYNPGRQTLQRYVLPAVSRRANPTLVNYTPYDPSNELGSSDNAEEANASITLKISDRNEKIMFNDEGLNDICKVDPNDIVTGLDHMLMLLSKHPSYGLNWMAYSEQIYPSQKNEFVTSSVKRTNYDNRFWRDDHRERVILGTKVIPSIGRTESPNQIWRQQTLLITQSSWPLDAQLNFLTRTGSIVGESTVAGPGVVAQLPPESSTSDTEPTRNYLVAGPFKKGSGGVTAGDLYPNVPIALSNAAGELQNNYGHVHFINHNNQFTRVMNGGLYSLKHMLGPFLSVANPTGMEMTTTGTYGLGNGDGEQDSPAMANFTQSVFINSGEAKWEAGDLAGIVRKSGKRFVFKSKPSKPWYDNYDDFRGDIKFLARDYVIVPEFRISENIEDYTNIDISANDKFDAFEIPGTGITSITSSFYDEYMNSEKMEFFKSQGLKTNLTAKELKISVKAVKKFNPYKGFYPAQRTIDLISQFSRSYIGNLQAVRNRSSGPFFPVRTSGNPHDMGMRPIYNTLFMPGLLYNSIKSGMAVDYPVVLGNNVKGSSKMYAQIDTANDSSDSTRINTWMIHGTASLSGFSGSLPGLSGSDSSVPCLKITSSIINSDMTALDRRLIQYDPELLSLSASQDTFRTFTVAVSASDLPNLDPFRLSEISSSTIPGQDLNSWSAGRGTTGRSAGPRNGAKLASNLTRFVPHDLCEIYNIVKDSSVLVTWYGRTGSYPDFSTDNMIPFNDEVRDASHGGFGLPMHHYSASMTWVYPIFREGLEEAVAEEWQAGTPFWDTRLPFETAIAPELSLVGEPLVDMEPHPSASINFSASMVSADNDGLYTLMARNFFGETANFFLRGRDFSSIQSGRIEDNKIVFKKGAVYGSRFKIRRSMGSTSTASSNPLINRVYTYDRDAWGETHELSAYSTIGGTFYNATKGQFATGAAYELPQDPISAWYARRAPSENGRLAEDYEVSRESFTMYSRPTAFGPAVSGRILTDSDSAASASLFGIKDSLDGYNWSFTPPYYHGEAWLDLVFRPTKEVYSLEEVLEEVETYQWRVDAGPLVCRPEDDNPTTAYISSSLPKQCIYDGRNVNMNAMQVTASMNMFGLKKERFLETDQYGNPTAERNVTRSTRWVIKPKFETPMLNFNSRIRKLVPNTNVSMPIFGSASVPIGMWHQFGLMEPDKNTGIFMEIGDIPKNWLRWHYQVRHTASIYNGEDEEQFSQLSPRRRYKKTSKIYRKMKSLADVFKFKKTPVRLGEIARRKVIREAIVAIPYRNVTVDLAPTDNSLRFRTEKQFFGIEPFRVAAALSANNKTKAGESLDIAGESIRKLVRKMKRYILPPQFDFLRNPDVDPIAMYLFEFHYNLDKDDLSYIWQNLAPRDYTKVRFQESSVAHELNDTEILDADDLMQDDVQWMIFKVKQKATGDYFTHVASQIGDSTLTSLDELEDTANKSLQYNTDFVENIKEDEGNGVITQNTYNLQYNWPYDYLSIVEGIKIDIEVMYTDKLEQTSNIIAEEISEQQSGASPSSNKEDPNPSEVAKEIAKANASEDAKRKAMRQLGMLDDEDDDMGQQGGGNY